MPKPQYSAARPDLNGLIDSLLSYNTYGAFMLTEVGHGLDARNLETTATCTPDGFILHTPTPNAAKFMPTSCGKYNPEFLDLGPRNSKRPPNHNFWSMVKSIISGPLVYIQK